MKIDIGLSDAERKQRSEGLGKFLVNSHTLYLKAQNFQMFEVT